MVKIKLLQERAALIQAVRSFFIEHDFLEVDTPIRTPAPVPEAHIEPVPSGDWFLQASPELCMKRLLCAGYLKIFQICKCFRNNERGSLHLPEMTMLEWYRPGTYLDLMSDCQALFSTICPRLTIEVSGQSINLTPPWKQITLENAFQQFAEISLSQAIKLNQYEEILVSEIEPRLGIDSPVFLCEYPSSMASLAKLDPENPAVAQRFELYINGIELANGFTELTNPVDQRTRFQQEMVIMKNHARTPGPMPEKFLNDLANMPGSAGIALGIDRLIMLLTGAKTIDEVVAFTPEEL